MPTATTHKSSRAIVRVVFTGNDLLLSYLLTACGTINRIRCSLPVTMAERASLYNFMARIGKSLSVICTKVGLFQVLTVLALFCAVINASTGGRLVRPSRSQVGAPQATPPQVFLLDAQQLEKSRAAIKSGDKVF